MARGAGLDRRFWKSRWCWVLIACWLSACGQDSTGPSLVQSPPGPPDPASPSPDSEGPGTPPATPPATPSPSTPPSATHNIWVKLDYTVQLLPGETGAYQMRGWTTATYDTQNNCMLLWQGYAGTPYGDYQYANSIWCFDAKTKILSKLKQHHWRWNGSGTEALAANADDPTPHDRHPAIAYAAGALWATHGLNSMLAASPGWHPHDTWKFDIATRRWSEVTPGFPFSGDASDGAWPGMVFDPSVHKLVVGRLPEFGFQTPHNWPTWLMDPATGTVEKVQADQSGVQPLAPEKRLYLAYRSGGSDPARVWHFGSGDYFAPANELWKWNSTAKTWTRVIANNAHPSGRIRHGWVYDSVNDVFLLFGGATSGAPAPESDPTRFTLNDTWVYDPKVAPNGQWSRLANGPIVGTINNHINMVYDPANNLTIAHLRVSGGGTEFFSFRYSP